MILIITTILIFHNIFYMLIDHKLRVRSSAVEHCLDTAGVTGSIPVAPTKRNIFNYVLY